MFCLFCLTVILVLSYVFHIRIFPILDENNVQQTRDFHLFGVEKYCISDNYTKKYGGVLWHFCGDQQPFTLLHTGDIPVHTGVDTVEENYRFFLLSYWYRLSSKSFDIQQL